MRRFMAVFTLALAMVGVFLIAGNDQAQARNDILASFTSRYGISASSKLNSCTTCHTGSSPSKSNLNPYGSALRASGVNFAAIENADSDGDGATNLAEIKAGTFPGSASDTPKPPASSTTTSTTSTTSTTTSTTSTTSTTAASTSTSTTSTTAPSTTAPKAVATATPVEPTSDGTEYSAGAAGSVWLAIRNGELVVTQVAANTDWAYSMETEDGEVEIEFRSGDSEIEFEAELEDGTISVKVDQEDGDNHESDDEGDHQKGDHKDDGHQDEDGGHDGHDD